MLSRFHPIPGRYGRTYGRTDGRTDRIAISISLVSVLTRDKKSSDFHEILYTEADFELDERHVIKNEKKLHWTDSDFDRTYLLFY